MGAHAFLPPSSAFRWVRCALSASLEAAYPEVEESTHTLEGTAAHWCVQMLLQGTPAAVGVQAPNGVAVTLQMIEAAELVRDTIAERLGPGWESRIVIERPVAIPRVHPTHNWGTPDIRAWSRMLNSGRLLLTVVDFKFGYEVVEAFENWQMIDYSAGILDEAGVNGLDDQETVVEMIVIQPRAYHRAGPVRSWRVAASDLRPYVNQLAMAAEAALAPNPGGTVTPEGCKDCTGRAHCEALQRAGYAAADKGGQFGALELSPLALGLELRELTRAKALLDARVSGMETQAEALMRRGVLVPFWMMEDSVGRLAWTKPDAEVFALGEMLGVRFEKAPELVTPTQAKTAARAIARSQKLDSETYDALIDSYASRPTGAKKLVADDGSAARLTFGKS